MVRGVDSQNFKGGLGRWGGDSGKFLGQCEAQWPCGAEARGQGLASLAQGPCDTEARGGGVSLSPVQGLCGAEDREQGLAKPGARQVQPTWSRGG